MSTEPGLNTRVIHHGESFASQTGTVMPPIFPEFDLRPWQRRRFDYTRSGNPNFRILDRVLASLEEADHATVFASGVGAITAVVSQLQHGDLVLCEENLYGCTVRLFEQVFAKFGLRTEWADFTQPDAGELIERSKPAMVWLESPTNPLLKVIDLKVICGVAGTSTFLWSLTTPLPPPLFSARFNWAPPSLTSTTKYINGHSDALGGVVCTNDPDWHHKMVFSQKALGLHPLPSTAGRSPAHQDAASAAEPADGQCRRPGRSAGRASLRQPVRYPHRQRPPPARGGQQQMAAGGAIVTVSFNASQEQTYALCKSLRWFTMAESLGGIESLICHPATMTHAAVATDVKKKLGIDDGLVRFSVGCEDSPICRPIWSRLWSVWRESP